MPNIFDGIRCMTDDEIRMEIALFSQVNFTNAAKETGNRVLGGLADMASSFVKSLGGKASFEYEIVLVADMVRKECDALRGREREWLIERLKELVVTRCGVAVQENYSDDVVSVMAVREAAATYTIEKFDTPANKLEKVSIEYNKALLATIHSMLINQSKEEMIRTDRQIQRSLDKINIEEKRHLQRLIMPKEFSGAGIARVLRLERGVKYLTYVVESLGVDCFDEIFVHTSTVIGAVKALRKMSRVMLAQLVWLAKKRYTGAFTVDEKILPSYMDEIQKMENALPEKEFRTLLAEKKQIAELSVKAENAFVKNEELVEAAKERYDKLVEESEEIEGRFEGLKGKKDRYVGGYMSESDTKRYYSDVNETNRQVDRAKAACEKQLKRIEELSAKSDKLQQELEAARKREEDANNITDERTKTLATRIQSKWTAYFFKMTFEPEVFMQVAEDFWTSERLVIEELLKEIHDSKDFKESKSYKAYETSVGKIRLKVSKNVSAYIVVEDGRIISITSKDIVKNGVPEEVAEVDETGDIEENNDNDMQ